ncbi:hypothetical protein D1872_299160 [compost metagenome]
MTTSFGTFGNDSVHAESLHFFRNLDRRNNGYYFNAMLLEDRHIRGWCTRASRHDLDFLLDDNLNQFGNVMHH